MTEAELLTAITTGTCHRPGLCALLQIWWYHHPDSRRSPAGLPDLILVGRRGILWRELKSADGTTNAEQDYAMWLLHEAGEDVAVWRPADLASGRIARELEAIR